jgi:hypothetical protein
VDSWLLWRRFSQHSGTLRGAFSGRFRSRAGCASAGDARVRVGGVAHVDRSFTLFGWLTWASNRSYWAWRASSIARKTNFLSREWPDHEFWIRCSDILAWPRKHSDSAMPSLTLWTSTVSGLPTLAVLTRLRTSCQLSKRDLSCNRDPQEDRKETFQEDLNILFIIAVGDHMSPT